MPEGFLYAIRGVPFHGGIEWTIVTVRDSEWEKKKGHTFRTRGVAEAVLRKIKGRLEAESGPA